MGMTTRFALPLLEPGQAQKEMTHNEALALLDLLTHASAVAADAETPPGDPEAGQCWILGAAPTGGWAGHAGAIAGWTESGWRFAAPHEGMRVWIEESQCFALFSSGSWIIGESHGRVIVEGIQLVGPQAGPIADPSGGATIDSEARAAINALLETMREHGLISAA